MATNARAETGNFIVLSPSSKTLASVRHKAGTSGGLKNMVPLRPFPIGRVAFFVTSNVHKFNEARRVLAEYKIATALLKIKALEIQDSDIESIAKASTTDTVEDAGLFIDALNGFPGPYSSYVHQTIGLREILRLMEKVEEREAHFHSVVAYFSPEEPPRWAGWPL